MSPIRAALLGTLGIASLLVVGAPERPAAGDPGGQSAVRIDNFNFTPPTLVVAPGTTVTWTYADDSPHTVREKDGKFKPAALDTDNTFSQPSRRQANTSIFARSTPYLRQDRRQTGQAGFLSRTRASHVV
jgi:plastocyanin